MQTDVFFSYFFIKNDCNNDDRMRLGRETQHVSVRCERTRLQSELVRARQETVPMPLDGETSTSRSRLSQGSLS